MPCDSSYLIPTQLEGESLKVIKFLQEAGLGTGGRYDKNYGRTKTLDTDVANLCNWCKGHSDLIKTKSLEFQIWWRDHQIADKKREEKEALEANRRVIKKRAISKLTREERKVLGLE